MRSAQVVKLFCEVFIQNITEGWNMTVSKFYKDDASWLQFAGEGARALVREI